MKKIRNNVFETNSSSTHTLSIGKICKDYVPFGDYLKIRFIDTDDETVLYTLQDKVSYLVSHIISWYKYDVSTYEELLEQVERNYDFQYLKSYVNEKYGKKIIFPNQYKGDIEDIVNINHQLTAWNHSLNEILLDLVNKERNLLEEVLSNGNDIEFGRD